VTAVPRNIQDVGTHLLMGGTHSSRVEAFPCEHADRPDPATAGNSP